MDHEMIYDPIAEYKSKFKQSVNDAAKQYVEQLAQTTNTNIEQNRSLVSKYKKEIEEIENLQNKVKSKKSLKGFVTFAAIFFFIIGTILLLVGLYQQGTMLIIGIITFVILVALGIFFFVYIIKKKITPIINNLESEKNKLEKLANKYKSEAEELIQDLYSQFDWSDPIKIIKENCPILNLDEAFDRRKLSCLKEKYYYNDVNDKNTSTLHLLSGDLSGNPFIYNREYKMKMTPTTYTGSIVITWTERVRESDGSTRTVTRSEVLTASVIKPAPRYSVSTALIYANDSAPKLSYTRNPSGMSGKDEKEIDKYVAKELKQIKKQEDKALKEGKSFVRMQNEEFEVLYGAQNRTDEIEFRVLFTPLAQSNMVKVIKNNDPFGDDFYFKKKGCLNFVASDHSQNNDIYCNPSKYYSYSYDEIVNKFVNYTNNLFRDIYFDMVPLLAIPEYQIHEPVDYIYDEDYLNEFSAVEDESFANTFNREHFAHKDSTTDAILKTTNIESHDAFDEVTIKAYSFKGESRVDLIPKMGGDGRVHNVPVEWIEYIPLEKDTNIILTKLNTSRYNYYNKVNENQDLIHNYVGSHYIMRPGIFGFIKEKDLNIEELKTLIKNLQEKKEK